MICAIIPSLKQSSEGLFMTKLCNIDIELDKISNIEDAEEYLLLKYNIRIKMIGLGNVKGFTYKSKHKTYFICINKNLSRERKLETIKHEFKHIELDHLEQFVEYRAFCEKEIEFNLD